MTDDIKGHKVVSHDEWTQARVAFLAKEKAFNKLRDDLVRERRALPWEKVEKPYAFEGPKGNVTLAGLFAGKRQLVVYHFMFDPEDDAGCPHCSFWADSYNGADVHLRARDTAFVAISRAPFAKIQAFKKRMGWTFPWVSSSGSDFNFDFQASFTPAQLAAGPVLYNYQRAPAEHKDREGISVFFKDAGGALFHTYSTYARGIDAVNSAYQLLELTPKGRDEEGLDFKQEWVRHRDRYDDGA